jgi:hypothetical protein
MLGKVGQGFFILSDAADTVVGANDTATSIKNEDYTGAAVNGVSSVFSGLSAKGGLNTLIPNPKPTKILVDTDLGITGANVKGSNVDSKAAGPEIKPASKEPDIQIIDPGTGKARKIGSAEQLAKEFKDGDNKDKFWDSFADTDPDEIEKLMRNADPETLSKIKERIPHNMNTQTNHITGQLQLMAFDEADAVGLHEKFVEAINRRVGDIRDPNVVNDGIDGVVNAAKILHKAQYLPRPAPPLIRNGCS